MSSFVHEGLEAGEPVMVAAVPEHNAWLRQELGVDASRVDFVDMTALGRNPARIIPAWQRFLDENAGQHRPVRGVGEPIWPGRRPEELAECQLHETMLNVAVEPETPFWLVCPYDVGHLPSDVVEEAYRSHPVILEADSYSGSGRYGGRAHLQSMFARPLPDLPGEPVTTAFTRETLCALYPFMTDRSRSAGLSEVKGSELAAAIQRLAAGSLHRGAGGGVVRVWSEADRITCEVVDDTVVNDLLAGRRAPLPGDADGLWFVNQHCDLVQLRSNDFGTTVRVHTWI